MPSALFDIYGNFEVPDGKSLEEVRNEFYRLIGLCIKEWARVESGLLEVCAFALKAPRKQAAIVYYRTPSMETRLTLAGELVQAVLPQREREDGGHDHPPVTKWKNVAKAVRELAPLRRRQGTPTSAALSGLGTGSLATPHKKRLGVQKLFCRYTRVWNS